MEPTKTCTTCGRVYPATTEFFLRAPPGKHGVRSVCKSCRTGVRRPQCSVPDCDQVAQSKRSGLCAPHHQEALRGQPLSPGGRKRPLRVPATCSFPDCGRPVLALGLCSAHWQQQSHGKELRPVRELHQSPPGMKWCPSCERDLPATPESYHMRKGRCTEYCKECVSARNRAKWASNPEFRRRRLAYQAARYEADPAAVKERSKGWRAKNPDKKLAHDRAWREANRERVNEGARRYVAAHRDEINARNAEWRRLNPEKALAQVHARRARIEGAGGRYRLDDVVVMYDQQGGCCFYCDTPIGDEFHIDHFIPLSRGGSNWPENLVLACPTCNLRKHAQMPWEFMPERFSLPEGDSGKE